MATKSDETNKDGTTSGTHMLHKAEEYVKNPTKMGEFTKERKSKQKEAKDKADDDKAKAAKAKEDAKK